jgi:hypothetical protein
MKQIYYRNFILLSLLSFFPIGFCTAQGIGVATVLNSSAVNDKQVATSVSEVEALTFILSNEAPGYLIDNLIANGYGDSSLYAVMQYLQPLSGGAIPQWFMDSLAVCPANSDVFTAGLWNFPSPSNNPIGIADDGSLIIAGIYGKDWSVMEGYSTYNDTLVPVSLKLFTKAIGPEFYIDAGTTTVYDSSGPVTTHYKAFAIAWSMEPPTTFVLSNEGGLIDDLIRAGHGDKNLYQTLEMLKPKSGGTIPQWFMDSLAACPANSEVFTAELWNFSDPSNNPIGIAEDGTLVIAPIYGRNYFEKEGYSTYNDTLVPVSLKLFTKANGPEFYIDAGTNVTGVITTYYKAFAIAWSMGSTFVLSNEGGLIDDLIRAGHGDKNLYQTLEMLKPKSGGAIPDEFMATLANCPAGSDIFTAALSNFSNAANNPISINTDGTMRVVPLLGKDYLQTPGYFTLPENKSGYTPELFTYANTPGKYIDTGKSIMSGSSSYKAFAIAWKVSTTFVLTNEGGLIDELIRAGHGTKNLYQTLEVLKPKSDGLISDEFMATLANCPAGSDIFTAALSNFGGLNNPICVNTDGTLGIRPIFGKDYYENEGYTTYPESQAGVGRELFTYSTDPEYYIDAGASSGESRYKAFAIAWSKLPVGISVTETGKETPSVYPNPTTGKFSVQGSEFKVQRVELVNLNGKVLENFELLSEYENQEFDISHLKPGVYFCRIKTDSSVFISKLILK